MSATPSGSEDQQQDCGGPFGIDDNGDHRRQHHSRLPSPPLAPYNADELLLARDSLLQTPRATIDINDRFSLSSLMTSGYGSVGSSIGGRPSPSQLSAGMLLSPTTATRILSPPAGLSRNERDRWDRYSAELELENHRNALLQTGSGQFRDSSPWGSPVGSTFALTQNLISPDKSVPPRSAVAGSNRVGSRRLPLPPNQPQTVRLEAHGGGGTVSLAAPNLVGLSGTKRIGTSSMHESLFVTSDSTKHQRTDDDWKVGNILKKLRHGGGGPTRKNKTGGDGIDTKPEWRPLLSGGFPMPPLHATDQNGGSVSNTMAPSLSSFRNAWQVISRRTDELDGDVIGADQEGWLVRESFGTALALGKIPLLRKTRQDPAS